MTPSARKQAIRVGAAHGREIARLHLKSGAHLGEMNRILKRLRDTAIARTILEGFYDLRISPRWRDVMVRAFQRAAIGTIRAPRTAPPITGGRSR